MERLRKLKPRKPKKKKTYVLYFSIPCQDDKFTMGPKKLLNIIKNLIG